MGRLYGTSREEVRKRNRVVRTLRRLGYRQLAKKVAEDVEPLTEAEQATLRKAVIETMLESY